MKLTGVFKRVLSPVLPKPRTPAVMAERAFLRAAEALGPMDVAVDCGANVGRYTEVLARAGARVFAFEPNPDAFAVLSQRMSGYPNVVCINKAVAAEEGTARLYLHENAASDPVHWSTGSSLLSVKSNVNADTYVEVEVVDFIEFLVSLNSPVALVKMDIEGAEVALLDRLLEQPQALAAIGRLFVETHDHKIPQLREGTDRLREKIRHRGLDQINLDWR